jgi:hypothetical protein
MVQAKVNTASEPAVLSFRHYMAGAMDADISEVDAALRCTLRSLDSPRDLPTHHGSLHSQEGQSYIEMMPSNSCAPSST